MDDRCKKTAIFIGGAIFGSLGIKLLTSKDAKNAYAHITAAGLRVKDYAMRTVTMAQENVDDIIATAMDINEDREAEEFFNECCCEDGETECCCEDEACSESEEPNVKEDADKESDEV